MTLILVLITIFLPFLTNADDQATEAESKLILFEGKDCQEPKKEVTDSQEDLDDWAERAHSIKLIGTWVIYENRHFGQDSDGAVEVHSSPNHEKCYHLDYTAGKVHSVQRTNSGSQKSYYMKPKISWFKQPGFIGAEVKEDKVSGNKYNLPDDYDYIHGSLILHGAQEWTVYQYEDQRGNYFCLLPEPLEYYKPRYIPLLSMCTRWGVRSVEVGCKNQNAPTYTYTQMDTEYGYFK